MVQNVPAETFLETTLTSFSLKSVNGAWILVNGRDAADCHRRIARQRGRVERSRSASFGRLLSVELGRYLGSARTSTLGVNSPSRIKS